MRQARPFHCVALTALLLASCRRDPTQGRGGLAERGAPKTSAKASDPPASTLDWVDRLSRCELDRAGVLIDLGASAAQGVIGSWSLAPEAGVVDIERDGESWARISTRNLVVRFILGEAAPIFVSLRARGVTSRSVLVALDGKPLGTLPLTRGQTRVVSTRPTAAVVPAGAHTIEIRFTGSSRSQPEPFAEIDWIRAGTTEEEDARTYAPPTLKEVVTHASLSGVPHRSVALRSPSTLRCSTFIPEGARLKVALGFEGQGEGQADIVMARDGERSVVLHTERVKGGDHAEWVSADVALDAFAGKLVTLELQSKGGTPGGRLLFGDPSLYLASEPAPVMPAARLVAVVMMSGLDRPRLANYAMYPTVAELQRAAATFEAHRAPTTVAAGVVASLLTGLPPRAHGLEDVAARLSGSLTTLGVAARDGSVQTAMFTGCPSTFEAFGFARGWDKYVAYSPVEGAPAVAPLTEAAKWAVDHMKTADARALVVVHARGGHPPWDVTINEAAKLAPIEYSGTMEPRRAGQLIARARAKHSRFRLSESDRTRMWAIYEAALAGQDRALGQWIDALKKANLWAETLFIVTGDVSTNPDSRAPFGDGEDMTEDVLRVPLWVHFPQGALSGKTIQLPTGVTDLSRSALDALRLPVPDGFEGVDLFTTASGTALPGGRALSATLGTRYSLRLGDLILSGAAGKPPTLCELFSDPNCEIDRLERMPRAGEFLFRMAYDAEVAAQKHRPSREPATIDAATSAALQVWGE